MKLSYESLAEFKRSAKNLITLEDGEKHLFEELFYLVENGEHEASFILLKKRFARNRNKEHLGTGESNEEYNKIVKSLVDLINKFEEKDFEGIKTLKAQKDELQVLNLQLKTCADEKKHLQDANTTYIQENIRLKAEKDKANVFEKQVKELQAQIAEKEQFISRLSQNNLTEWESEKQKLEKEILQVKQAITKLEKENKELQRQLAEKTQAFSRLQAEYNALKKNKPNFYIETVMGISFKMIKIPATEAFEMGGKVGRDDKNGIEIKSDQTLHTVKLSSFYMAETPVTQALWQAVMGNNPSLIKGDNLPVTDVSWHDAQAFISKLAEMGLGGYCLPSEAQWEYAARGNENYLFAGSDNLASVGWYGENAKTFMPVKTRNANAFGLYDMSGNVWEWCQDVYKSDYYKECKAKGVVTNPIYEGSGSDRVGRGGSWLNDASYCSSAYRDNYTPTFSVNCFLGFRLSRTE